ncbi:MAG TPA: pseudouridine-5'-phosphate glycosidase [Anaeromyxobacteraceae bacterium]|nr:pseudouridine-5'-phosphate glycosidase [Anaeromyxobacteraceae bacterium]
MRPELRLAEEVRAALEARRPVVALETSVVAHGLPWPDNLEAARCVAAAVRSEGAVPAAVAILGGVLQVGAGDRELARLAEPGRRPAKASVRDLAPLLAAGRDAGTTVSATAAVAALAGIRLFATGGIGGVHRRLSGDGSPSDVSADLPELGRAPVCVVCAGPKAVLDVPATAEALETLGIPVLGFGVSELPAFFTAESGVPVSHRVEGPGEVARVLRTHWGPLARPGGVLLAVPPPHPLPRAEVEGAVSEALVECRRAGLSGPAVTPFLLEAVARRTGGRSRQANLALLEANARVAARVASALAEGGA